MNAIARLLGNEPIYPVGDSPLVAAITENLSAMKPGSMVSDEADLAERRIEHTEAWEAYRRAIWANMSGDTGASASAVKEAKAAMDALDPPIDRLRDSLRIAREKLQPKFRAEASKYNPPIADKIEAALELLSQATAELGAIDAAASSMGAEPLWPARLGHVLPQLSGLVADLRK